MIPLESIMKAQQNLTGIATKTPFMRNHNLSEQYESNIWLKREDMQVVRSFKIRGAYNKMCGLSKDQLLNGIVCASAGNHAQGVALACRKLGINGTIFMPSTTPNQKVKKVEYFGKENVSIQLIGDTYDDAYQAAQLYCDQQKAKFIHPFNDVDVIAGQSTVGVEMMEQMEGHLDILLVAVGGGGLMAGVGSYFKKKSPSTRLIAVEAAGAAALEASIKADHVVELERIEHFADGIAVRKMGDLTFSICRDIVDEVITVPEGHICSTLLQLYNEEAIVVEPAGAVSIAALDYIQEEIKGKNVGIIICGGNNDITRTEEIKERALLFEGRKHYFIIKFPQRAGALKDFLNVLGPNDDITHFQYTKKNSRQSGPALVGIELQDKNDYQALTERMSAEGINYQHINHDRMLFDMLV